MMTQRVLCLKLSQTLHLHLFKVFPVEGVTPLCCLCLSWAYTEQVLLLDVVRFAFKEPVMPTVKT